MTPFQILAALITLAAVFSYLNHRYLRLPQTIGVMVLGLATSLILLGVGEFFPAVSRSAHKLLDAVPLSETLLQGMLGYLLFAGALHLNVTDVWAHRRIIFTLATVGVVLSTVIVAGLMWFALHALNIAIPWSHCLLFGALISPTDPIAVLAIMKSLRAPKALEVQISGESLFNDGIGVVVFIAVLSFAGMSASDGDPPSVRSVLMIFFREAVGGAAFGLFCGLIAYQMLKRIDQYRVEILISLALVTGGYALAQSLHVSGPIAMVVAGLFIGNRGRQFAMSEQTRVHLDLFWELIDDILNSILFLLIGLEVLVLRWERVYIIAGLIAIVVTLLARLISVTLPIVLLRPFSRIPRHAVTLLTWGGLRGGISVALALSLRDPAHHHRGQPPIDILIVMTYVVVVFSIGVQGLTIGALLRRTMQNVPLEKE
jgi:CPA1 family monovalent cation:H+ antiporter